MADGAGLVPADSSEDGAGDSGVTEPHTEHVIEPDLPVKFVPEEPLSSKNLLENSSDSLQGTKTPSSPPSICLEEDKLQTSCSKTSKQEEDESADLCLEEDNNSVCCSRNESSDDNSEENVLPVPSFDENSVLTDQSKLSEGEIEPNGLSNEISDDKWKLSKEETSLEFPTVNVESDCQSSAVSSVFTGNDSQCKDEVTDTPKSKSDSSLVESQVLLPSPINAISLKEELNAEKKASKSGKHSNQSKRILYSGYKKKSDHLNAVKPERRILSKTNPFNPSWKKGSKMVRSLEKSGQTVVDLASDSPVQDCTHYLGLQPSINFRCNHCGLSGFESIQMLNLHQGECRKVLGHSTSTNIKITRKVYLCSACGTYYESWHLFYHMRKVHDKFMCLYCLGMFTYSEKLCEHLMTKHQVNFVNFPDNESFKKCNLASYLFLCLECDNVMSDADNFHHVCTPQKSSKQPFNQGQSVPCVGTVTVVAPTKLVHDVDGSSKSGFNEEFVADPSSFCHVDMQSPNKNIPVPEPIQPVKEAKQVKEKEVEPIKKPEPVQEIPSKPTIVKEPHRINSFFPKIDLQPPKNIDITDKHSECDDEFIITGEDHSSESPKVPENRSEGKSRGKTPRRQRNSSGRQPKRPKLDPEQQKSALEKLTETIDAVAKNYSRSDSPPPSLSLSKDDTVEPNTRPFNSIEMLNNSFPSDQNKMFEEKTSEDNLPQSDLKANNLANGISDKPLIWKPSSEKTLEKFKLHSADLDSDDDSDDSNKLSMAIDDTPAHSDNDSKATKITIKGISNASDDSNLDRECHNQNIGSSFDDNLRVKVNKQDDIALAGDDVPAMALTLDDKVENVKVQLILKECVRTSCMSCNYCRRAIKIAVNGKYLALHLLSEHRYTPTKSDTPEDVINKLKSSLNELSNVYFNTESYDSSDSSIHVPYDKDNTFDCFQCNYVTYSHKDLHLHKKKSHTKSLLLCIMCKINFYSYSELLCHLCPGHYNPDYQYNKIDVNFRCCFCKIDTIPSAFRLMVHLRKCHHTCDICLEVCSDQQKLSTHMWKHKLNHLCYRCGIAYASKLDITKHLFWKHGTESVLCKKCLQKKWPHVYHFCIPPTSFLCEECNSSFSKAVALKVHKRIHAGDFSYHCTQCEKKFVSKKLLQRHEDQHNRPVEPPDQEDKVKEEIIDVTGESVTNIDGASETHVVSSENLKEEKEVEISKHHKKHKKDKKSKQVIDVYDLPPLNLSSESDSSDEESTKNTTENEKELKDSEVKCMEQPNLLENTEQIKDCIELKAVDTNEFNVSVNEENLQQTGELGSTDTPNEKNDAKELKETDDSNKIGNTTEVSKSEQPIENTSIWENFYKTNSNNKNLPYPLCAMKSEDAYKIIMGDHDYCLQVKTFDPIIKEDILQTNMECDTKTDNATASKSELCETTASESSPTKKKQKSPKKKSGNNSSSSSDSSSDSDSSSCSCGENCSCSSSSSDSSSSSSSDSESSISDGASKQRPEKRKKKKERKTKVKTPVNQNGENKTIVETSAPAVPEEPTIRESELETEESSTDEEFYDRQPQKRSNQLLAEKRNQLMLLASVAPAHGEGLGHELAKSSVFNDAFSDFSTNAPSTPDPTPQSTKKNNRNRRKKSFMMKSRKRGNRNTSFNHSQSETVHRSPKPINVLKLKESKRQEKTSFGGANTPPSFTRTVLTSETHSGAGSESESVRSSKRKRIPNKFYGYSSGEEEERSQTPKWKKAEVALSTPQAPPLISTPKFIHSAPPQTPKIQISVPKQIIRKNHDSNAVHRYISGNDSTDSSSDTDRRFSHSIGRPNQTPSSLARHSPLVSFPPPTPPPLPPLPPPPLPQAQAAKQDKNLYCFCRCPYDEVSEMIACDDENCKIEWFHFECVGISVPPKGQWFCPQCSKKRGILS